MAGKKRSGQPRPQSRTDWRTEDTRPAEPASLPVELAITSLNSQGQGVGRIDGLVVFVDGAVPGDQVTVQLTEKYRQYAVGEIRALLQASPDRQQPFCAVAAPCGGCALQAVRYPVQLRYKQQQVIDLLQRIGQVRETAALVRPVVGMANPRHYRSKVQFPVGGTWQEPQIGFYGRRSHQIVDASRCDIQHPVADAVRAAVRQYIRDFQIDPYQEENGSGLLRHLIVRVGQSTGQVMVILVVARDQLPGSADLAVRLQAAIAACPPLDPATAPLSLASFYLNINPARTNVILGPDCRLLTGASHIVERILGLRLRISPLSFFQVNPSQTEVLYQETLTAAALTPLDTVLDLYCGTGSISLVLARTAGQVIGVESIAAAIDDARVNAAVNQLPNVRFVVAEAEAWLPVQVWPAGQAPTVAVVDPPRKGCAEALLTALTRLPLRRLVYVSCNPATLARDIAHLQPFFQLRQVQPVDMFPWSDAVECVALLDRLPVEPQRMVTP